MDTAKLTSVGQPAKTDIRQLCADTACRLDDLRRMMADRDGWWEKDKRIQAIGTLHDKDERCNRNAFFYVNRRNYLVFVFV